MRSLGAEAVDPERAQEADDAPWNALRDLCQGLKLAGWGADETVETPIHAIEDSAVAETAEVRPRDLGRVEVLRPEGAFAGEAEERFGLAREGGHSTERCLVCI